jgi:hypothetical protein
MGLFFSGRMQNYPMSKGIALGKASIGKILQVSDSELNYIDVSDVNSGQFELVHSAIPVSPVTLSIKPDREGPNPGLYADGISVDHSVYIDRSKILAKIYMAEANIKGNLSFRGTELSDVTLTGARVAGDLRLGAAREGDPQSLTNWVAPTRLLLDHTYIGLFRAALKAWPNDLTLNGAKFGGFETTIPSTNDPNVERCDDNAATSPWGLPGHEIEEWWDKLLGGWGISAQKVTYGPPTCYYEQWLGKASYTPSAYDSLQQTLKNAGNEQQARAIGIIGRNRERSESLKEKRYIDWAALMIWGGFIGYGYMPALSAAWAMLFIVIGAVIFRTTSAAQKMPPDDDYYVKPVPAVNAISYSFDLFLPVIQLRKFHYDLEIQENWQRRYFYLHKIAGYILGFFIIAIFAGLTK